MIQTIIKPARGLSLNLIELWQYRDLFYFLAWRDIKVRYKQTSVGILWAILQPFLTMIVFSVFFGKIAGLSTGEIPYPIFTFTGLIFWNYFANSLNSASDSLVANQRIIQKIYFPRIIMPLAASAVFLLDFLFAFFVLICLMFYYHFIPQLAGLLLLIPCLLITFLSFSGLGLMCASINVKYRDIRYALPFFIQLLIFLTPVIYPSTVLGKYQWLWFLNPMSGVIDTMRVSLLGTSEVNWALFMSSLLVAILLFFIGIIYFKKLEKQFADII